MSLLKTVSIAIGTLGVCGIVSGIATNKIDTLADEGKSSAVLDTVNAAAGIPNTLAELSAEVTAAPIGLSVVLLPISIPLYVMCPKFREAIGTLTSVYLLSSFGSAVYKNTKYSILK